MATSSIPLSMFGSPGSSIGKKLNFKDMAVADNDYSKDKDFIMKFDGWDDYQKLVNAVKHIFSGMISSNICAMSYNQLIDYLFVFLDVEESKSVFFDFALNKHYRLSTDTYNKLKNLETCVEIEREFTQFLHESLDEKDKTVYVSID